MRKTYCPNCDAEVKIEKPKMGAMLWCRQCGVQLEVISLDPFQVNFPLDYEENWDDDD